MHSSSEVSKVILLLEDAYFSINLSCCLILRVGVPWRVRSRPGRAYLLSSNRRILSRTLTLLIAGTFVVIAEILLPLFKVEGQGRLL
jgi:hypothetical protein